MAKSLSKIVYSIIEQCSHRVVSDDSRLDFEFIADKVHDVRLLLLKEDWAAKRKVDDGFFKRSCCFEIKCGSPNCEGNKLSDIEYHYVSLPKISTAVNGTIRYAGTVMDNQSESFEISILSNSQWKVRGANPYIPKKPIGTLINNSTLVLENIPEGMKYICVDAVWENPIINCETDNNADYPIPGDLIHKLEIVTIQHVLSANLVGADVINNALDDTTVNQQAFNKQQKTNNQEEE